MKTPNFARDAIGAGKLSADPLSRVFGAFLGLKRHATKKGENLKPPKQHRKIFFEKMQFFLQKRLQYIKRCAIMKEP